MKLDQALRLCFWCHMSFISYCTQVSVTTEKLQIYGRLYVADYLQMWPDTHFGELESIYVSR